MKPGFIYILTNIHNTTLYIGVTSNIVNRIEQHIQKTNPNSFTAKYNLSKVVYYEAFHMIGDAIAREKQLKSGNRSKKVELIKSINPNWDNLFESIKQEFLNS